MNNVGLFACFARFGYMSGGDRLKTIEMSEVEMSTRALQVQYVSDEEGQPISVIVPIELWREIASERETAYLLGNETMKKRLLEAKNRTGGISLDDARAQLGI